MNLATYSSEKILPLNFLKSLGIDCEKDILRIPYHSSNGKIFRVRYRQGDKRWWGEGESILPYGLERLDAGLYCCLCEGESDTQTLWYHGFRALGVPGASTFRAEWAEYLKPYSTIYLAGDSDTAGQQFNQKVAAELRRGGYQGEIKLVELPKDVKDVNDLHRQESEAFENRFKRLTEKSVLCTTLLNTPCTETTLKLRSWKEVLFDSVEEREWVVQGVLPKRGLAVLGGWAKEGKSTFAIHLCRAVAQGKPFLGRETEKMPAIYINYEMPEDYRAELMAASEIPDTAFWLDRPEHILTIETIKKIIAEANSECGLLVIDTFRGAFRPLGESENQVGGAGVIVRDLQKVATETGWLVVLIHHKNKTGRLSGTGDFQAAADVIMLWKRPNPQEPGTLEVEGRMAPIEPMAVRLTLEAAELIGDAKDVLAAEDMKRVLQALTDEPVHASELAEQLKIPAGSVRVYLAKLFRDDKIGRLGSGKRGDPYLYHRFVTEDESGKESVEGVQTVISSGVHNTETQELALEGMKAQVEATFGESEEIQSDASF